jgi:magnesium dechelatase
MSQLDPNLLHITLRRGATPAGLRNLRRNPRRYTLTHSDITGDLFLSIGMGYAHNQISGLYTRLMRDEVLAEWLEDEKGPALHVYCHVSGGPAVGSARWRYEILQNHMRQVLQAFRCGDRPLFDERPDLDKAHVYVHFNSNQSRYNQVQDWGKLETYRLETEKSS